MDFYNLKIKQFDNKHIQLIKYDRSNIVGKQSPSKGKKIIKVDEASKDYEQIIQDRNRSNSNSISRTINTIYDLSRSNEWEYFVTFTFNPNKVNSFDYDEVVKKIKCWIDMIRRTNENIKYIGVPEKHISGRYHFHFLFSNVNFKLVDSGKLTNKGLTIYNIGNYKFGFSTAIKIYDFVGISKYLCKYITKDLCYETKGKKRYWRSRNLNEPIVYTYDTDYEAVNLDLSEFEVVHSQCKVSTFTSSITGQIIENKTEYIELVKAD